MIESTDFPILPPLTTDPLVSVMIVNYNYERFLPEAIESVLGQSYTNFELIICDDGSQDNSPAVIQAYAAKDPRIRTILKENGGVATALNATFRASVGEIITMLDADDLFEKEKIAKVVERFRPGGRVGTVLNTLKKVDTTGAEIGHIPEFGQLDRGELRDKLLKSAAHWSIAPTSGMSFRRACAERVFPIPEKEFRTEADGYMCTVAPLFFAVDVIEEPMTVYRVHSSNLTASTSVTVKSCERIISAGERVFAVLSKIAAEHGWPVTRVDDNPTYCEMRLMRDYLNGESRPVLEERAALLKQAADRVDTADRRKTRMKSRALRAAVRLPLPLGQKILDAIYLPSPTKATVRRLVRFFK